MKLKIQTSTIVIATILGIGIHGACATGIPVVDGALNGLMQQETKENILHRAATITHYGAIIQNWIDNFQNQIRNQIMGAYGLKVKTGQVNIQEVLKLLDKKKNDCNRIANLTSKQYCKEMIDLEKLKITNFQNKIKEIEAEWVKYQKAVKKYNDEQQRQNNGAKNAASVQAAYDEIQSSLKVIHAKMAIYEQDSKIFDQRIETLRKARVQIAQEQMRGTNLVTAIAKGAVAGKLKHETDKYKNKAKQQRNHVSNRSQEAFSRGTTAVTTKHKEF